MEIKIAIIFLQLQTLQRRATLARTGRNTDEVGLPQEIKACQRPKRKAKRKYNNKNMLTSKNWRCRSWQRPA